MAKYSIAWLRAFDRSIREGSDKYLRLRAERVSITFEPLSRSLTKVAGKVVYFANKPSCRLIIAEWAINQWSDEQVLELLLHEYAHALTLGHGHDAVWSNTFRELKILAKCTTLETAVYYSAEQRNVASSEPIDISAELDDCNTIDDCLALSATVKRKLQGTALAKAKIAIGNKMLSLAEG